MFADGQQQDSHEFLMVLLDSLHEELNKPKVSGATSLLLYAHERLHYAVLIGLGLLFLPPSLLVLRLFLEGRAWWKSS